MRPLPLLVACLLLAACSRPEAPDKDRPVEPQAAVRHDEIKRAINAPLQRAQAAQANVDHSAKSREAAIEAAERGHVLPET